MTQTMLIGGMTEYSESLADVILYDWTNEEWTLGTPMQTPRKYHSCTIFGSGLIMVAGGYDYNHDYIKTIEIYEPEINSWYYTPYCE